MKIGTTDVVPNSKSVFFSFKIDQYQNTEQTNTRNKTKIPKEKKANKINRETRWECYILTLVDMKSAAFDNRENRFGSCTKDSD